MERVKYKKSAVVISHAPKVNYMHNYSMLPYYYGTDRYFDRPDVKAIRETVFKNLDDLNEATGFADVFRGRELYIKPNNVMLYYDMGLVHDEIPENTDPRVLEAIIDYFTRLECQITIIESPGKPAPAYAQFKEQRFELVCKRYGCKMVALEEQAVDHYYIPKAEVMKDTYIPEIVSRIVRGEALYISVPKLKTNLYTEVTLGMKNAMGILPANVRFRNHNFDINKKLADLFYLVKPDLTVIDGIIGGEGNTPGPVDPVKVGVILSGTNAIETDRVATKMMGFDPDKIKLTIEADRRGFGDPDTEIIGEMKVVPFRPADRSLMSERFHKNWPNVHAYVGHTNPNAPEINSLSEVTPEIVREMEKVCDGGCLPTLCYLLELNNKLKNKGDLGRYRVGIVYGNGFEFEGERYWFDRDGNAYTVEMLKAEKKKHNLSKIVGVGHCCYRAKPALDDHFGQCCNVGEITNHMALVIPNPIFGWNDRKLIHVATGVTRYTFKRALVRLRGKKPDIKFDAKEARIFDIPEEAKNSDKDWIFVGK